MVGNMPEQKWIMHAYDSFLCGSIILYVPPDGKICTAIMITPLDRWWTEWRLTGLCSLTGEIITYELDEYQDVLVIRKEDTTS